MHWEPKTELKKAFQDASLYGRNPISIINDGACLDASSLEEDSA